MERDSLRFDGASGRWMIAVTGLGSALVFLDATVVNVALPTIGRDFDASTGTLQWILNSYLITLASFILLGGSLGDRYGRRRIFTLGVVVFTAASVACAVAPTAELLVLARMAQGAGGALLTPGSLAMIEASFRAEDRPRAIGAWSGIAGVGSALGPLVGGYFVQSVSWRAIFLLNVPLGCFAAAMAGRHIPESRDSRVHGTLDLPGAALGAIGLAGITYALIDAPDKGASPAVVFAAAAGVVALVAFLLVERRRHDPMLPLEMFSSRQFSAANAITFVVYAALGGVFFLLIAYLQVALGYTPIAAGAATLPITVLMLFLSPRAGALAQRIGPRLPLTVGPAVLAVGMALMIRIEPGTSYFTTVLPAVIVFGLGLTLVVAPVTATVLAAADTRHSGIASGINNAVSRIGGLLAVAVLPTIAGLTGHRFYRPAAMVDGFPSAMLATAALALIGAAIAWCTIDVHVLDERRDEPVRGDRARSTHARRTSAPSPTR